LILREEFRKAPILRALIPLVAGIICARIMDYNGILLNTGFILVCIPVIFLLILVRGLFRRNAEPGIIRCYMIFLQGAFFLAGMISLPGKPGMVDIPHVQFTGRICSDVLEKENTFRLVIDKLYYYADSLHLPIKGKVQLYIQKDVRCRDLRPGMHMSGKGGLRGYRPPEVRDEFDYAAYLADRGIYYTSWLDSLSWNYDSIPAAQRGALISPRITVLNLRGKMIHKLGDKAIPASILLGYRGGLTAEIKTAFRRSGSMHILAISGLHVGILYFLPFLLIRRIRRPQFLRISFSLLLLVLLWSYAFLTGLSASVSRAAGMCSLFGLASISGRRISHLQVISLSAFSMLLVRPTMLFEAGFQLSFLAISGIAMFYRRLFELFSFKRCRIKLRGRTYSLPGVIMKWLWRMTCLSVSAQAGTAPLVILHFGEYPVYSFICNLVAVPLATLILYNGVLFFSLSWLPGTTNVFSFILSRLGELLEWFTGSIASLPGAVIGGVGSAISEISILQVALLYVIILSVYLYLERRSPASMLALPLTALLFLLASCFNVLLRFTAR